MRLFSASMIERQRSCLRVAQHAHRGQKRRDGMSYITHPVAVAEYIQENFQNKLSSQNLHLAVCAAFLHDAVEDSEFSTADIHTLIESDYKLDANDEHASEIEKIMDIVSIVSNLSKKPYADFISDILNSGNELALIVKYSDMCHNMKCCVNELTNIETCSEKTAKQMSKYAASINRIAFAIKENA